jgi:diguanylate cyclase (GGDEF)-like protein/PAS domain S-box-containing protein
MAEADGLYKEMLDNLHDGVYFVDRRRRITYWNKGAERITGYLASDVVGHSCPDNLLNHEDGNGKLLCRGQCPLAETMADGQLRQAEVYLHNAQGQRLPVLVRASPLRDQEGRIIGAVETFSDNSNAIATRQRVTHLLQEAENDALTGLSNRRTIERRLQGSLAEWRQGDPSFGLLFIDIDYFKLINDTYGHAVGDQTLKMIADTLRRSLRGTDLVGRWGGEEFVIVLYGVEQRRLASVANKLRALIAASALRYEQHLIRVTASIGATLNRPGDTLGELVRRADQLLYRSKAAGRNCVSLTLDNAAVPDRPWVVVESESSL